MFAKLKKEYTATVKDLKIDVAALKSHKHAALGFQQEIQQHSDIMEDVEDQIVECQQALKETEQELLRVSSIAEEYDELVNDAAQKKDQVAHLEVVVSEKLGMLQEDLTSQTTRALKEMVRDFDAQMGNQVEQRKELEEDMQALKQDLAKLQNDKTALQAELGRLQEKKESNDRHLTLRYEKMVELGNTFGLGDALTPFTQSQPSQQQTTQNSSFLDLSMTGDGRSQLQTPILDIPQQDMSEYFRAVTKKEEQMKETLSNHKQKYQSQEDQIGDQLAELKGKLKSIETSRAKLTRDSNDARKKIRELSSADSADSSHRIRKTDVEEAVRNAQKYAADRETANSDPRRNQIPIEIRSHEDKIDRLNREIQDDQDSLKLLRDSAEAQNSIHLLQEQCNKGASNTPYTFSFRMFAGGVLDSFLFLTT